MNQHDDLQPFAILVVIAGITKTDEEAEIKEYRNGAGESEGEAITGGREKGNGITSREAA